MQNLEKIKVTSSISIRDAIQVLDHSAMQIVLVIDASDRLIGTVTDGDIRRGILSGISLDESIAMVMNTKPKVCLDDQSRETVLARMKSLQLRHMPILNAQGVLVSMEMFDELLAPRARKNAVMIMAGGLGTRLRPLTEECPKPMLKIGGRPILETILLNLVDYGFRRFYISVNYKSEMITEYFGDGSSWGIEIEYLHESQKLGTAGSLSLLPKDLVDPIVVMNGDLLTKINFEQLLDFHAEHVAAATMCVRGYEFQVPYGVVKTDNHKIVGIEEKPVQSFFINAGVYVLEPRVLKSIPMDSYLDMPSLYENLIKNEETAVVFPVREYWIDVGHLADFERANNEYKDIFS